MDNSLSIWLDTINQPGSQVVFCGPGETYRLSDCRRVVRSLATRLNADERAGWVLQEPHGFRFLCALTALIFAGKEVILPNAINLKKLLGTDTSVKGFIGNSELFDRPCDLIVEIPPDEEVDDKRLRENELAAHSGKVCFHTSGSTGSAKVIEKTGAQLLDEALTIAETWPMPHGTLVFPLVSHLHIYGLAFGFLYPLVAGGATYLSRVSGVRGSIKSVEFDPGLGFSSAIVVTSPTLGRQIEALKYMATTDALVGQDAPLPINRVFSAGGRLSVDNARRISQVFGSPITEILGSTETGAAATRERLLSEAEGEEQDWRLLTGLSARTGANDGRIEPTDYPTVAFEIWGGHVSGSEQAPTVTGDLVRFTSPKTFKWLGRGDSIVKIEGKRVSVEQMRNALEKSDLVKDAVVVAIERNNREALVGAVVLSETGESYLGQNSKTLLDRELVTTLLDSFDSVLVPKTFRYLESLPMNDQGKLSRETVISMFRDQCT